MKMDAIKEAIESLEAVIGSLKAMAGAGGVADEAEVKEDPSYDAFEEKAEMPMDQDKAAKKKMIIATMSKMK